MCSARAVGTARWSLHDGQKSKGRRARATWQTTNERMGKDKRNWSGREQNHHTSGLDAGASGATFWTKMNFESRTGDGHAGAELECVRPGLSQQLPSHVGSVISVRVRGRKRGQWNVGRDRLKSFSRWAIWSLHMPRLRSPLPASARRSCSSPSPAPSPAPSHHARLPFGRDASTV